MTIKYFITPSKLEARKVYERVKDLRGDRWTNLVKATVKSRAELLEYFEFNFNSLQEKSIRGKKVSAWFVNTVNDHLGSDLEDEDILEDYQTVYLNGVVQFFFSYLIKGEFQLAKTAIASFGSATSLIGSEILEDLEDLLDLHITNGNTSSYETDISDRLTAMAGSQDLLINMFKNFATFAGSDLTDETTWDFYNEYFLGNNTFQKVFINLLIGNMDFAFVVFDGITFNSSMTSAEGWENVFDGLEEMPITDHERERFEANQEIWLFIFSKYKEEYPTLSNISTFYSASNKLYLASHTSNVDLVDRFWDTQLGEEEIMENIYAIIDTYISMKKSGNFSNFERMRDVYIEAGESEFPELINDAKRMFNGQVLKGLLEKLINENLNETEQSAVRDAEEYADILRLLDLGQFTQITTLINELPEDFGKDTFIEYLDVLQLDSLIRYHVRIDQDTIDEDAYLTSLDYENSFALESFYNEQIIN